MNPNAQPNTLEPALQTPPQDADNLYNVTPAPPPERKLIPQAYLPQREYAWTYYEAQKQARLFFLPFNEYERIAANKIREDLTPNMPRVNDGSLAAILMETPMRILAQPFTGFAKVLESIDPETGQPAYPEPWLQDLINILWTKEIVPYANTQAPFFTKQVLALYKALIYGSQPIYSFFTNRNGRRIADMALPYIRDVYLEVGKHSDLDSDYVFMDQYYTRLQLDKIIAAGNRVEATGVKSPWNLEALKQIRDSHVESQKDYLSKNPAERNRPVRSTQIKFTTVFQRGVDAPFDTFYAMGNKEDLTIVKSKRNEDPTGDIPIHLLYAYEDLINPYGKGQIEVSGGTQNVLDYLTQLHVLANQIGLQPPIVVEGDRSLTDLDSMIYAPSQFWFTGTAKVDVMETSSSMVKEFPQAYQLYKSQLVGAQGTTTTDVSSDAGDPLMGKTPKAVNQQSERQNAHDNHLLKQCEQTFALVFKSMLNIHFANMQGSDVVRLEAIDAAKLLGAGILPPDPQNPKMPETNEIEVEWEKLRGKFDFEIDPDSSLVKNNEHQVAKLLEVTQLIAENPYMLQYIRSTGKQLDLGEVYQAVLTKLGLQDLEKILKQIPQEQLQQEGDTPPMAFDKPKIELKYPDMPPQAQVQLLGHVGLNVSLLDVLMGPVLDPNIRGVYQPEPQPGNVRNPVTPQADQGQPPIPPSPQGEIVLPGNGQLVPNVDRPETSPSDAMPAMDPAAAAHQQIQQEKGVPPHIATGVMRARSMGIPEEEIDKWLATNVPR